MCGSKYPQIQYVIICTQERSETQLHYRYNLGNFKTKALGFTQSLFNVTYMERHHFSITFQGLMASVQPNLRCYRHF